MGGEPTATPLLRRAMASGDRAIQTTVKEIGAVRVHCAGGHIETQNDTHLYVLHRLIQSEHRTLHALIFIMTGAIFEIQMDIFNSITNE